MFAARIEARGRLELIDIDPPNLDDPSGGDIIFRPELACLCGSDLPFFDGEDDCYPRDIGMSLHEMIGTVVETNGTRFREGDRVLAVPEGQRGFYERYRVSETRAIPLDPHLAPEQALLAQPLGTAIFAARKLGTLIGKSVVVVGQGPMGHIFNALLANFGARQIIVVDKIASRLTRSQTTGATHVVDSSRDDPEEAVRELTGDRLADIVIEAVGHRDIQLNLATALCRQAGTILSFGVPPVKPIDGVQWSELFFKNITVHTSVNPDFEVDFPLAMQWIGEGRIDLSPLVTHRFPVAKTQEAFETFRDRKDGALKVFLDIG